MVIMHNSLLLLNIGHTVRHADDTSTLICSGSTPSALMNSQLCLINEWILGSKMKLKYSIMWFYENSKLSWVEKVFCICKKMAYY